MRQSQAELRWLVVIYIGRQFYRETWFTSHEYDRAMQYCQARRLGGTHAWVEMAYLV